MFISNTPCLWQTPTGRVSKSPAGSAIQQLKSRRTQDSSGSSIAQRLLGKVRELGNRLAGSSCLQEASQPPVVENADKVDTMSVSSAELDQARQLMDDVRKPGGPIFHATTSEALAGIGQTGELMSASMLDSQDIERVSGEGDTMGATRSRHYISLGENADGFHSALGYYYRLSRPPFTFSGTSNAELAKGAEYLRQVAEHPTQDPGELFVQKKAKSRLVRLEQELTQRFTANSRPQDTYPIAFGFRRDGLNLGNAGEPGVAGQIDSFDSISLRKNLERVVVPKARMSEVRGWLEQTLGQDHEVRVVPSEAVEQLSKMVRWQSKASQGNPFAEREFEGFRESHGLG